MFNKIIIGLCVLFVVACTSEPVTPAPEAPLDPIAVTTDARDIMVAARAMNGICKNPAEFGRCGCTMNGLATSCDIALRCLEAGFCKLASSEVATERAPMTTLSSNYRELVLGMQTYCANPAEYWRCECSMDGVKANCAVANLCLKNGFCEVARD